MFIDIITFIVIFLFLILIIILILLIIIYLDKVTLPDNQLVTVFLRDAMTVNSLFCHNNFIIIIIRDALMIIMIRDHYDL